ncbi:endonuclease/exonuclease/phosphatase family protein [Paenibacillus sp. TRM 82003]|uniref:endonuclease/exonuclease/phosphatase family protein n=1 Tax=Kineococcus sp. TRM81007 TaxID=2925831 RepID=UPI001F596066|nr:endonuclease/exonuclease/phosphatase family protein [Kineococcus sp. TRM81007]MCI2238927.1 endonuclease/exonuclease/phosphatase family protein [Kineococcus sp. TRM81007]MCI3924334.1 endonuclease/exonuclease/phosphatase family protein [Paenibacillus sp. TRM 82003]
MSGAAGTARALALVYGVGATAALAALAGLGDSTALTYVAGLTAFWWLLPALAVVPAAVAVRAWGVLASVLAPAVAAGALLGPHALPGRGGGDADLRVATFNLTGTRGLDGLRLLVERWEPDVLLLQEVSPAARRFLDERYPQYPHRWYGPASPVADGSGSSDGDAVWATVPVVSARPVTDLPDGARPGEVVVLDARALGGPARLPVLSLHLASPCLGCTPREREDNPAGGTGRAARTRVAEALRYADVTRDLAADGPVVVGGDLNSSDFNEPLRVLTGDGPDGGGLTDVHRAVGDRPQLTRGSNPGYARVDAVLVAGLEPVADAEAPSGGSTHSPVVAELRWEG